MVAGVQTQFVHLRNELARSHVSFSVTEVNPWVQGGHIEKLPLPSKTRGTIRSLAVLRGVSRARADAIWSQVALPLLPYLLSVGLVRGTRVFYAIDCTPKQLFDMGDHYRGVTTDPHSPKGRLTTALLRTFFRRSAGALPWSQWAARSMIEDYGANPDRVHVLAPGIDTNRWKPADRHATEQGRLRLLFVGADFERKGGRLLLDLYRSHLRDRCDLDLVTKADLPSEPGIRFHTGYRPDDPALLRLFQMADLLVVPTLADCFSIAAIEAMACGIPVITSRIGGIPEIVLDGTTGYLIAAGDGRSLLEAVSTLVKDSQLRRRLGKAGRAVASRSFDASTQAQQTLKALLGTALPNTPLAVSTSVVEKPP
jgi:glycosyltransferase involved in cell wall biosynthesis